MSKNANSDRASELRQMFVDDLKSRELIRTLSVEEAFRAVPRHLFLPDTKLEDVYQDQSIPTKSIQGKVVSSSSQPAIMATMLEQLGLETGHRVLEIGAGTGYNAALMAHIVGDAGRVVTVDIDQDIVEGAQAHLSQAGFERTVEVICGDGGLGYPNKAPYDRIILTVGAWDITPTWLQQLKRDGRLLIPLSIRGPQVSVAFEWANDHLESISVKDCDFMGLRGSFAGPKGSAQLHPEISILTNNLEQLNQEAISKLLTTPSQDLQTDVSVSLGEVFGGLRLWLAFHEPGFCSLNAYGTMHEKGIIPDLFRISSQRKYSSTIGLVDEKSICVLTRSPQLSVRKFGEDSALVDHLIGQIRAWNNRGRPSTQRLSIKAYPIDADYLPPQESLVEVKRWTRLVLSWQ
jgi:protein-L-isoaspartate(D-aspartate) O-methyltransferase